MFLVLLASGWAVSLGVGVISHFIVQHVLRGHRRTLKICVPHILLLLNAAAFFEIPVRVGKYYDAHYTQNPELPGPLSTPGSLLVVAIWAFFTPLLCGYALYLMSASVSWLLGFKSGDV